MVSSVQDLDSLAGPAPAGSQASGSEAADARPNYLYVCAFGHSGSTLLEMLLAGHPEMVAVGELHNLNHQIAIGRHCSCGALPRDCPRWQAVAEAVRSQRGSDLFERPFAFRVSHERPRTLAERLLRLWNRAVCYAHFGGGVWGRLRLDRLAVSAATLAANTNLVVETVRRLARARILIDSSKDYIRMRERYAAAPAGTMRVIYLYRDGRGVTWSVMKSWRAAAWYGAKEWAKSQRRIRRMLAGVRPEDRLDLRYEDLCSQPEATLRRLCAWLGVDYAERMIQLAPGEHHTIAGNKIRLKRGMTIRIDEAWRSRLTRGQLRSFRFFAGAENRRLGYPDA